VLNNNICQPWVFVYIQPVTGQKFSFKTFYIRNSKWGEEKWPPDMLKITVSRPNFGRKIFSLCRKKNNVLKLDEFWKCFEGEWESCELKNN